MLKLKLFGFFLSIFLLAIIFLSIPQDSLGLSSFVNKGSPRSNRKFLNILTACGILIYLWIALELNLLTTEL
jgi:preprotein translocase subunit SecG